MPSFVVDLLSLPMFFFFFSTSFHSSSSVQGMASTNTEHPLLGTYIFASREHASFLIAQKDAPIIRYASPFLPLSSTPPQSFSSSFQPPLSGHCMNACSRSLFFAMSFVFVSFHNFSVIDFIVCHKYDKRKSRVSILTDNSRQTEIETQRFLEVELCLVHTKNSSVRVGEMNFESLQPEWTVFHQQPQTLSQE